jgi:hypothetical protein
MSDFEYLGKAYKVLSAQVVKEIIEEKSIKKLVHPGSDPTFPHLFTYGLPGPSESVGRDVVQWNQVNNLRVRSIRPVKPPGQILCTYTGIGSDLPAVFQN